MQRDSPIISQKLVSLADSLGENTQRVASQLLENSRFHLWSGSSIASIADSPKKHHYGKCGLLIHTYEVVGLCLQMADTFPEYNIDKIELFLAALYHDAGKMYDYERIVKDGVEHFVGAEHKRMIHHISRSALIWHDAIEGIKNDGDDCMEFYEKYHDSVLHAILAHHGLRTSGSPVAPKSRVAWLVHLCDSISARMCDADDLDVVRDRP
jgi:3'-5' exoribonuclease